MKRKTKAGSQLRADRLVKQVFPGLTGRQIEEALDSGLVLGPRDKRVKKGEYFDGPQFLDFSKLELHLKALLQGNPELVVPVVHAESGFLVVDKPPGIPSHPLSLFDSNTITQWAFAKYPEIRNAYAEVQPTVTPHRLDTGTSGLLVVALTQAAFQNWRRTFQKKEVRKKYLAWCWGTPEQSELEISAPIGHHPGDRRKMVTVTEGVAYAKPLIEAKTQIKVIRELKDVFLAEVSCETGVTHQVRVHLAGAGYPLVGDRLYDSRSEERHGQPSHHLLRAFSLIAPGFKLEADTSAFRAERS